MKWSFSSHKAFRRCQRQWFFRNVIANACAKDPLRREAHRLSKLLTVWSWRGRIVDSVLSESVIPQLACGKEIPVDLALQHARRLFEEQRAQGLSGSRASNGASVGFVEVANGLGLTDETFAKAWKDIEISIRSFYGNKPLIDDIAQARRVVTQRPLSFNYDGAAVCAVPDVICFYDGRPPFIIDWKVNTAPIHDFWLQLATYAIALTRCNPHRDWPPLPVGMDPTAVRLAEVQLLANSTRGHTVTDDDVDEITDLIYWSFDEMRLACCGKPDARVLQAQDFLTAYDPSSCRTCAFQKLCSGGGEL